MDMKDDKPRLIRYVLLLQEFSFEVKDQKICKNQVVDYFSQLENERKRLTEFEIDDSFLDERVLIFSLDLVHQYANFFNYLVGDRIL